MRLFKPLTIGGESEGGRFQPRDSAVEAPFDYRVRDLPVPQGAEGARPGAAGEQAVL
jgi:hypothetical protein